MNAVILRDYQESMVGRARLSYSTGHKALLEQLPTGGGKTVIFAAITASARGKGKRVLVVVHRRELVRQAVNKLADAGVSCGVICAGFKSSPDEVVQVCSVQTIVRRLEAQPQFDLIIVDECHHAVAGQYRELLSSQPRAKILGVTATPLRLDGKGLGVDHGGIFDDIVVGASIRELVEGGYLAPCRIFAANRVPDLTGVRSRGGDYIASDLAHAVDTATIVGDCVVQYRRHADHLSAIAFCVTVEHAEHVAERFCAAGYRAACIHGKTPTKQRDAAIAGLATGAVEVLTSCEIISEGLDVPSVRAVLLLRPTKSLGLFMQQVGRGMRPAPGKQELIVLDHVGNVERHGMPALERIWTLDGVEKAASTEEIEHTGGGPRKWDSSQGQLIELTQDRIAMIKRLPYRLIAASRWTEQELRIYAQHKGFKPGWVWHRLRDQWAAGGVP